MGKSSMEYYMNLPYRLVIVPDQDEGGYAAYYPDLKGCVTCSETMEGVCKNAVDAKRAWLEAALEDGIKIPEPSTELML